MSECRVCHCVRSVTAAHTLVNPNVISWEVTENASICFDAPESWLPIQAPPEYVVRMRSLWLDCMHSFSIDAVSSQDVDAAAYTVVPAVPEASGGTGPTPFSTGLGLPLSRALAKAGGGWLGLEDGSVVATARSVSQTRRSSFNDSAASDDGALAASGSGMSSGVGNEIAGVDVGTRSDSEGAATAAGQRDGAMGGRCEGSPSAGAGGGGCLVPSPSSLPLLSLGPGISTDSISDCRTASAPMVTTTSGATGSAPAELHQVVVVTVDTPTTGADAAANPRPSSSPPSRGSSSTSQHRLAVQPGTSIVRRGVVTLSDVEPGALAASHGTGSGRRSVFGVFARTRRGHDAAPAETEWMTRFWCVVKAASLERGGSGGSSATTTAAATATAVPGPGNARLDCDGAGVATVVARSRPMQLQPPPQPPMRASSTPGAAVEVVVASVSASAAGAVDAGGGDRDVSSPTLERRLGPVRQGTPTSCEAPVTRGVVTPPLSTGHVADDGVVTAGVSSGTPVPGLLVQGGAACGSGTELLRPGSVPHDRTARTPLLERRVEVSGAAEGHRVVDTPAPSPGPSPSAASPLAAITVAFVDDEQANCRLGVRMLARLGVPASHVTVLKDGEVLVVWRIRGWSGVRRVVR